MILRIHRALCTIPVCAVCLLLDDLDRVECPCKTELGWVGVDDVCGTERHAILVKRALENA